jgi:very-short-patch-repair endonuclease
MKRPPGIVTGQSIGEATYAVAKTLRNEMTASEKLLWQRLRGNCLRGLHFRRQQIIRGFIADFYCHAAGLVVEVDGPIHDHRIHYDAEREQIFNSHGVRLIRFTNEEVDSDIERVLAAIASACLEDDGNTSI